MSDKPIQETESLLTYNEVCKLLNLKHSAIKALMDRGMPHYQLTTKLVRFQRTQILAWLDQESDRYKESRVKTDSND